MEEGVEMGYIDCSECKYCSLSADEYPCRICYPMITGKVSLFEPKSDVPEQPTVPPMPPVNPPKIPDEINHPDRYAGGQYECIDVMVDVFGVQAVRDFCKLNAFKYLWREEKKGGIEDVKKAVWYLEKFIELGENL